MAELQYWQSRSAKLPQVHTTTFSLRSSGDETIEILVSSGVLKSEHQLTAQDEP